MIPQLDIIDIYGMYSMYYSDPIIILPMGYLNGDKIFGRINNADSTSSNVIYKLMDISHLISTCE